MQEILFIGGERHGHRMPVPPELALTDLEETLDIMKFGEDKYYAAGKNGYSFHPDEHAKGTWIMWHERLMVTSIERVIDLALLTSTKRVDMAIAKRMADMQTEAGMIRAHQEPHVYSGIQMIKFASQRHNSIRFKWSWLGFELQRPINGVKRFELEGSRP